MSKRAFSKDDVNFVDSEWFVAKITTVGTTPTGTCEQIPYGWKSMDYCANGQGLETLGEPDLQGSVTDKPAYAIDSTNAAAVDDIVLMRFRGTFNGQTVYEFYQGNGGSGPTPSSEVPCFTVKSVSCSAGMLMVTYADSGGCVGGSCIGGVFYKLANKLTVPNNTATVLPNGWSLIYGDLADMGLEFDGNNIKNTSGGNLNLKVTLQYAWSAGAVNSTRNCYIIRGGSASDVPVSSFVASNDTQVHQVATNLFTLGNNTVFTPYAWQNSGSDAYLADPAVNGVTTMMIERYCG